LWIAKKEKEEARKRKRIKIYYNSLSLKEKEMLLIEANRQLLRVGVNRFFPSYEKILRYRVYHLLESKLRENKRDQNS
jgi:hypothetical protein